jgi:hypothetical protein
MQVFRKKKASKKHTWRTQEDAISLKQLPSNKKFLQQKQKFGSNLSFFFKNLSSRKGFFTQKQNDTALSKERPYPSFHP